MTDPFDIGLRDPDLNRTQSTKKGNIFLITDD